MKLSRTSGLWLAFIALAVVFAAQPLLAAKDENMLDKILCTSSGAFGISLQVIILLASVFMLGWSIECLINIRRDKLVPPECIAHLQGYLEEGDLEGALQYCESAPNMLTRPVGAALSRMHLGWDAMKEACENTFAGEGGKISAHLGPLSLITALGPMLGLFGTVAGMVGAFDEMTQKGESMSPADVAGSIGLALMSTVIGLLVAMPGMTFFFFINSNANKIMDDVGGVLDEQMTTLRGYMQQQQG